MCFLLELKKKMIKMELVNFSPKRRFNIGEIKKNERGRVCGAYGVGERCAQGFGGEA
jgi:hypothetical protein